MFSTRSHAYFWSPRDFPKSFRERNKQPRERNYRIQERNEGSRERNEQPRGNNEQPRGNNETFIAPSQSIIVLSQVTIAPSQLIRELPKELRELNFYCQNPDLCYIEGKNESFNPKNMSQPENPKTSETTKRKTPRPKAAIVLVGILFLFGVLYAMPFANFSYGENVHSLTIGEGLVHSPFVAALQRPEPKPADTLTKLFVILETIFAPLQAALLALAIRRKFMR